MIILRLLTVFCAACIFATQGVAAVIVHFNTNFGSFEVSLYDDVAPLTVANFLQYVNANRYDNSMIHRVDVGLGVIQGGGYTAQAANIQEFSPIVLEYSLANTRGTISMARTSNVNSATSEWFINTDDNSVDLGQANGGGYAVFGQVLGNGMDVVDAIAAVPTFAFGSPFGQVPLTNYTQTDFTNHVDPLPHIVVVNSITIGPVPEPSSLVLAAFGLVGLAAWRRKRSAVERSAIPRVS